MKRPFTLALTLFALASLQAHDSFEITLEIQEKRNSIEAELEMACSTAVAACDPAPSNGILFEPEEFPLWEEKIMKAAPELIKLLNEEGAFSIKSIKTGLSREDDVLINYTFTSNRESPTRLSAPILNRFPPDGFGVRVTYRDKTGHWHPPFMIFVDKTTVEMPQS